MVIRKATKRNADPEKRDMKSVRETLDTHVHPPLMEEFFGFFFFNFVFLVFKPLLKKLELNSL